MSEAYKTQVKDFLSSKTIRDIPAKDVLSFPSTLPLSDAFSALIENDVQSAPVYENENDFIGFLDIRDLVSFVVALYANEGVTNDTTLNDIIATTKMSITDFAKRNTFEAVSPDDDVLTAAGLLARREVHRIPVVENGVLINIVSQSDIIQLIAAQSFQDSSPISDHPDLGTPCVTVPTTLSLIDSFGILEQNNITGLPLVDSQDRLTAITSGKDLKLFLRHPTLEILEASVFTNLKNVRAEDSAYERALTVSVTRADSVARTIQLLAATGVHRLFVVDNAEKYRPQKAISFTDLLAYLVV